MFDPAYQMPLTRYALESYEAPCQCEHCDGDLDGIGRTVYICEIGTHWYCQRCGTEKALDILQEAFAEVME
jgi:hypothetical protein